MEEGVTRNIYEIFEIIMAVATLLLIGSAILYVQNPDSIQAHATATEVAYISSEVSGTDLIVETNYKDTTLESQDNLIKATYKSKSNSKKYIGEVNIETMQTGVQVIESKNE